MSVARTKYQISRVSVVRILKGAASIPVTGFQSACKSRVLVEPDAVTEIQPDCPTFSFVGAPSVLLPAITSEKLKPVFISTATVAPSDKATKAAEPQVMSVVRILSAVLARSSDVLASLAVRFAGVIALAVSVPV